LFGFVFYLVVVVVVFACTTTFQGFVWVLEFLFLQLGCVACWLWLILQAEMRLLWGFLKYTVA